ncbi:MAG: hypothetical protein LBQ01_08360 [Prevotellaceae bacterium]|jgi:hypothetical protein|nr:hypothetical protein [Prevotellaceae bacterium]
MNDNRHLKAIPLGNIDEINLKLREAKGMLDGFAVPLTPEERRNMPKMGEKTVSFVQKAYELAKENDDLRPSFLNMDEFSVDYSDATNLRVLENNARQILDVIDDIIMVAGSESYLAALSFYEYVKILADRDVPRAKAVYEELKKRFPFGRRKSVTGDSAE